LAGLFEVSFPEVFEQYQDAFLAGAWFEANDPGPWLNRAVVWKLDVGLHYDGGDGGPTVTFPVGFFIGGHMQVPQLGNAVFEYLAGHVLIMYAGKIAHKVTPWVPAKEVQRFDGTWCKLPSCLTPGRISGVYF
ncbi:uncharacterized protein BXZ73DRAFT_6435, partial [Epithele typhae]|uniref:uncharacterized protein n=1 Tax=Epithele typhae TaxID=378194 RepID=UPI002007C49A